MLSCKIDSFLSGVACCVQRKTDGRTHIIGMHPDMYHQKKQKTNWLYKWPFLFCTKKRWRLLLQALPHSQFHPHTSWKEWHARSWFYACFAGTRHRYEERCDRGSLMLLCWYVPAWYTPYETMEGNPFYELQLAPPSPPPPLFHWVYVPFWCCELPHI